MYIYISDPQLRRLFTVAQLLLEVVLEFATPLPSSHSTLDLCSQFTEGTPSDAEN